MTFSTFLFSSAGSAERMADAVFRNDEYVANSVFFRGVFLGAASCSAIATFGRPAPEKLFCVFNEERASVLQDFQQVFGSLAT